MKTPIHRWKEYRCWANNQVPPHWTHDGRPCWLGSGVIDKNGIEIFEGDVVKIGDGNTLTVIFDDAAFWLGNNEFFLYHFEPSELEVIGHIVENMP